MFRAAFVGFLRLFLRFLPYENSPLSSLLSIVEREMWLKKIQTATPADLCEFRNWLNELFPDNVFRQNANDDIKILQFLCDNIHPDEVSDCIQRLNLNWLQEQIKRILQLYSNKRLSLDSET